MPNRYEAPEVNSGSMADIAFLLLIFFLVTTVIETDAGLDRLLPEKNIPPIKSIKDKNILEIAMNARGELWVDDELIDIRELKNVAIGFIDNGGAIKGDVDYCDYCKGKSIITSSDNPTKAVIVLNSHRESNYGTYITVQNELVAAYNHLRNRYAQKRHGQSYLNIQAEYNNPATSKLKKEKLLEKLKEIKLVYPMKLIEAEIK